jgi:hypothetical protein
MAISPSCFQISGIKCTVETLCSISGITDGHTSIVMDLSFNE